MTIPVDKIDDAVLIQHLWAAVTTGHFPDHKMTDRDDIEVAEYYNPIAVVRPQCIDKRCPANRFGKRTDATMLKTILDGLLKRVDELENRKPWWKR